MTWGQDGNLLRLTCLFVHYVEGLYDAATKGGGTVIPMNRGRRVSISIKEALGGASRYEVPKDEYLHQNVMTSYPCRLLSHVRHCSEKSGRDRCRVLHLLPPGKNPRAFPVVGGIEACKERGPLHHLPHRPPGCLRTEGHGLSRKNAENAIKSNWRSSGRAAIPSGLTGCEFRENISAFLKKSVPPSANAVTASRKGATVATPPTGSL